MFRSHVILIAMAALASVPSGLAQNSEISINSKVSPEQIKEWLQSSYPIQVAWGAYFASKSEDAVNDDVYVTIMSRRLARWVPPQDNQYSDESFRISRPAISEILYALIEKNETVPAASLTPITLEFPAESLILAARLPGEESAPMLEDWYKKKLERLTQACDPFSNVVRRSSQGSPRCCWPKILPQGLPQVFWLSPAKAFPFGSRMGCGSNRTGRAAVAVPAATMQIKSSLLPRSQPRSGRNGLHYSLSAAERGLAG